MNSLPTDSSGFSYIIYSSSAVIRLSQRELLELLLKVRQKNEARGLTGMLLYRNGVYLQYLEGPREEVRGLLEVLKQDSRHESIRTLREGLVPRRLFPDWSMAYKNLSGLRTADVPGYSERLQAYYSPEESTDPVQMLIDMFQDLLVQR